MSETTEPNVGTFTLADPLTTAPAEPVEVPDHAEWPLPNGFAWVFPADGNTTGGLVRPVIMADGFNLGRSELDKTYQGLESDYEFISELQPAWQRRDPARFRGAQRVHPRQRGGGQGRHHARHRRADR